MSSWLGAIASGFAGGAVAGATNEGYVKEPSGGSNPPKDWGSTATKAAQMSAHINQNTVATGPIVHTITHPHVHVHTPEAPPPFVVPRNFA